MQRVLAFPLVLKLVEIFNHRLVASGGEVGFRLVVLIDLSDVEPTSHPLAVVNVWQEDESRPSLSPEDALANAPDPEGGAFRVPAVGS